MITTTVSPRLADERRLLSALFLFPRAVFEIDARHFIAADHALLFEALQDAFAVFPWEPVRDGAYDDMALAIVMGLVRQRITEIRLSLGDAPAAVRSHVASVGEEYDHYIARVLMAQAVTAHAVDDLIDLVHACPRCGR